MTLAIRSIIADDERLAREKLRILLASEPGVQVVAECRDGGQTIRALSKYRPDLLLLDIHMPGADGFNVLQAVPQSQRPLVIFTTAYDAYALRAFEEEALDYLLKPFDRQRLHRAIQKTRAELLKIHDGHWAQSMMDLLTSAAKPRSQRFVVRTGGRVVFLDLDEIAWIEAAANYVKLHASAESYLVRESFGSIVGRLDPAQFIRIHRSLMVNISRIKELQPCNSGEYMVILKDGKQLGCSRGYRSGIQKLIDRGELGKLSFMASGRESS